MIGYGRGGGGGGLGGFPYRSSHQQGQDGGRGRGGNRGGGRGRGGRGLGRGGHQQQQQQRRPRGGGNATISFQAELEIPQDKRRLIVGRGGSTLKHMRESTGAKIFVPYAQQRQNQRQERGRQHQQRSQTQRNDNNQQQAPDNANHPVRVNTFELPSLLHAFHEISELLSESMDEAAIMESIPCVVKMKPKNTNRGQSNINHGHPSSAEMRVDGRLYIHKEGFGYEKTSLFLGSTTAPLRNDNGPSETATSNSSDANPPSFPPGSLIHTQRLNAYCTQTCLSQEDVDTIVDNIRFVDSSMVNSCQYFYRDIPTIQRNNDGGDDGDDGSNASDPEAPPSLVFVFGSEDGPRLLCQAIQEASFETGR